MSKPCAAVLAADLIEAEKLHVSLIILNSAAGVTIPDDVGSTVIAAVDPSNSAGHHEF